MSLLLYADHNIDFNIVVAVRRYGINILIAKNDRADRLPDEPLFERAVALNRILCTEDKDFLRLTARWWREGHEFPGVIYGDQDAAGIGAPADDIALIAIALSLEEVRNRVMRVPRR